MKKFIKINIIFLAFFFSCLPLSAADDESPNKEEDHQGPKIIYIEEKGA